MKVHFLGTCAGTEPMPGRKHASVAVESGDRIYWFDAGEGCSYTAHLMGIDLLKVKKIVISHPHMDHVGGLGNLLWNIRKLSNVQKRSPIHGGIEVHIPLMETWEGIMSVLRNTENGFKTDYPIMAREIQAGVVFDDGVMKVTAFPNSHLAYLNSAKCLSFSYLIECEEKKLVYSGDVGKYQDLDEALSCGCDGLIIETGHFNVDAACEYVKDKKIERIFFSHNGREILYDPEGAREKVRRRIGDYAVICEDGMTVEL